jgi:hypothetical protein
LVKLAMLLPKSILLDYSSETNVVNPKATWSLLSGITLQQKSLKQCYPGYMDRFWTSHLYNHTFSHWSKTQLRSQEKANQKVYVNLVPAGAGVKPALTSLL